FIRLEHAEWAIAYVKHYTAQTLESVRRYMHDSQFSKWRSSVLDALGRAGARGLTERELARNCRPYAGLEPRMRRSVMDSLKSEGLAEWVDLGKGPSGRGRARLAWVALQDQMEHDDAA